MLMHLVSFFTKVKDRLFLVSRAYEMTETLHIKVLSVIMVKNDEDHAKASATQFFPEVS